MSRTLIGSSNVQRFYTPERFSTYKPYIMLKTCNLEVYKTRMGMLEPTDKFVVIQVLENLFEDAVKNNVRADGAILEDVLMNTVKATIAVVINLVRDLAVKLPETKFILITPITRPSLEWYTLRFDEILRLFEESMGEVGMPNIRRIKCFSVEAQVFGDDMLHLTQESGDIFVESILMASEKFFAARVIVNEEEAETEMEVDSVSAQVKTTKSSSKVPQKAVLPDKTEPGTKKGRILALEKRMKTLEEKT